MIIYKHTNQFGQDDEVNHLSTQLISSTNQLIPECQKKVDRISPTRETTSLTVIDLINFIIELLIKIKESN